MLLKIHFMAHFLPAHWNYGALPIGGTFSIGTLVIDSSGVGSISNETSFCGTGRHFCLNLS